MIIELQDKISKYITQNALLTNWKDIREKYAQYTYITFLCLIATDLEPDCNEDTIGDVIRAKEIEEHSIVKYVFSIPNVKTFIQEILDIIREKRNIDINSIYQSFLSSDFILFNNKVVFESGKNNRDILGSYYTQEDFAYEITRKAVSDYFRYNHNNNIRVADYSCGGGAFLVSACRLCNEKNIAIKIYGYDVDPIAVLITRYRLYKEAGLKKKDSNIYLGNPLLRNWKSGDALSIFRLATSGDYYNIQMGIVPEKDMDIIVGNPPWEKIRFEEKKFLHHFVPRQHIGTKAERAGCIQSTLNENREYYNGFLEEYDLAKKRIKNDDYFKNSSCGELNTYALFTELCMKSLKKGGITGIIVKSSLVKMPVYSNFFKKITEDKSLYELYMFVNRKKIFNIDSREEFSVIYLKNGNDSNLWIALNLDNYTSFCDNKKIEMSYELLNALNPETGMIPNIKNDEELNFLISAYKKNRAFGKVYPNCRFGRLVHLTNHSDSIIKNKADDFLPIYEGKFIEIYTGKYATFKGMSKSEKYKNKATARVIEDIDGAEYPEARFYVNSDVWKNLSKNFDETYIVAWRSLSSSTNRRTMISTVLPLVPTCQSIQLLQLQPKEMLHVLAIFNSIIFDYIVRLKMAGLDLTQTIIKQVPVPNEEDYVKTIVFKEKKATIETHINSRIRELYKSDKRMDRLFESIETYSLSNKGRKEIISEIDKLIARLYSIEEETLKGIASCFEKYYSKEEVKMFF